MARKGHPVEKDRTCDYCGWMIKVFIPHECDPSICRSCKGKGDIWLGRDKDTRKWLGYAKCDNCNGTGRIRFGNEDNLINV